MLYLYGISAKAPKAKITGSIDAASAVENLEDSGLVAWFSRVSDDEFGDKLASNMENLEWLAGASVSHQRVVSQIADTVTVLPARFGTVFLSRQSLIDHLREEKEKLG